MWVADATERVPPEAADATERVPPGAADATERVPPEFFAAFLISNELAIIDKTDDKTDEYVDRYFHWWWGIEAHNVPMAYVLCRLPCALLCAIDRFNERITERYHTNGRVAGFLLALATFSNY